MANGMFTSSGVRGVPMVRPIFTGKGYAPALYSAARERAKATQDQVSQYMGQKGMLESSGYQNLLGRAYQGAFNQVGQEYAQQQAMYMPYTQQLLQMKASQGAEQKSQPWWQKALTGAIGGGLAGLNFAGSTPGGGFARPLAPVVGAVAGGLLSLL